MLHFNRLVFWINSANTLESIERADIDGGNRTVIVNNSELDYPRGIALDRNGKYMYSSPKTH